MCRTVAVATHPARKITFHVASAVASVGSCNSKEISRANISRLCLHFSDSDMERRQSSGQVETASFVARRRAVNVFTLSHLRAVCTQNKESQLNATRLGGSRCEHAIAEMRSLAKMGAACHVSPESADRGILCHSFKILVNKRLYRKRVRPFTRRKRWVVLDGLVPASLSASADSNDKSRRRDHTRARSKEELFAISARGRGELGDSFSFLLSCTEGLSRQVCRGPFL